MLKISREMVDISGRKLAGGAFQKWGPVGPYGVATQLHK